MADMRRYARLKGTIQAVQRTKIRTERMKHAAATAKEKLDGATEQNEQDINEQASNQVHSYASGTRTTVRRTVYDVKRIRKKAARAKAKRSSAQNGTDKTYDPSPAQPNATSNYPERPAVQASSLSKADFNPVSVATSRSSSAATSKPVFTAAKPISAALNPSEIMRQKQVQRVRQNTQRSAQAAQRSKVISEQIRKRAAIAARKASRAAIDETKAMVSLVAGGGAIAMIIIVVVILFGCSIAMFGSGNGSSYTPVSAEVNAYEPLIRHYAALHQIPEYVELIKAVMMQESGGRGNDPMQASECGYNQRFPRTPNGITDPEYSINVGVRELAECLRLAEVDSPLDMDRIRLALQGYNFGEGYISWAKARGGYTALSAKKYSDMMSARNHWESYGDINYVNHVLQYYPLGHAFLPGGNQMLVEVARSQLGNIGGDPYWSWYGFDSRVEWCACFVSWCCDQCGYIESEVVPKYSYCPTGADWFKEHNQWAERDITPQPGMIIFFDWARGGRQDGETDHTGIVEKVENGRVFTIEGNSGNACREKSYPIGWYEIYGYGTF